jgi:hypothetical protein
MVTNGQVYLIVSIPALWNALLLLLGIAFIERRSLAREKLFNDGRNRWRAELRREQDALGATWSKIGAE